jgi:RNA polymerase sigma-70 factor, ECF subfamily
VKSVDRPCFFVKDAVVRPNSMGVAPLSPSAEPDLGAIFDEHFAYVWNTLRHLGIRPSDLEDMAHEVFLRVHTHLQQYDPARPIRPWLFGFAYRIAADYRRLARNRFEMSGLPAEPADPAPPVDERLESHERATLLHHALAAMDLDRRAVLILHYVEGVPVGEIARALRIPLNTAYSRLRLAREDLARAVKTVAAREVRRG